MESCVEMVFWDVQHGHATYIKSPNGRHIVIDLGTGDYSGNNINFSPLRHLRYHYGVTQLDYVVITHPHMDHIDDIYNFDLMSPKTLLHPTLITEETLMTGVREQDKHIYNKYLEICGRYTLPVSAENNPNNTDNYGGMEFLRFMPTHYSGTNLNNYSIVTVFKYAGVKVVVPGDNENSCLDVLMEDPNFTLAITNADILLAPHHGRNSACNTNFLNTVNPRLTIVSDGKHCDTSANARYSAKSRGWTVYKAGQPIERKCLTTNSDGEIYLKFGYDNDKRFLNVKIK